MNFDKCGHFDYYSDNFDNRSNMNTFLRDYRLKKDFQASLDFLIVTANTNAISMF